MGEDPSAEREHSPRDIELGAADREELLAVISLVYNTEAHARRLLRVVEFPPALLPAWSGYTSPESFWEQIFAELDRGLLAQGYRRLLQLAARTYPANPRLQALYARYADIGESGQQAARHGRNTCHVFVRAETEEERTAAFETLRRLDLDPREELSTELVTSYSVSSDDVRVVRNLLRDSGLDWTVASADGAHHVLRTLTVLGPDGSRFLLRDTPAAETLGNIATEVLATQYPGSDQPDVRPTVISQVREEGLLERADPDQTLGEAGVAEGDEIRVAFESRAG